MNNDCLIIRCGALPSSSLKKKQLMFMEYFMMVTRPKHL